MDEVTRRPVTLSKLESHVWNDGLVPETRIDATSDESVSVSDKSHCGTLRNQIKKSLSVTGYLRTYCDS